MDSIKQISRRLFLKIGALFGILPPPPTMPPLDNHQITKQNRGYPKRKPPHWTGCSSYKHMLSGVHSKLNLDEKWLKSLSKEELLSLHDDSHEGKLKWSFVFKKGDNQPQITTTKKPIKDCPNGKCPTKR